VTDQDGATTVEQHLQVLDLVGDRERALVRIRTCVSPAVVANNPEPMVQLSCQSGHPGGSIERTMDQDDDWCVDWPGLVTMDAVSGGCHMII
jgi:hypothetical protein